MGNESNNRKEEDKGVIHMLKILQSMLTILQSLHMHVVHSVLCLTVVEIGRNTAQIAGGTMATSGAPIRPPHTL